jgi:hypothetical protein
MRKRTAVRPSNNFMEMCRESESVYDLAENRGVRVIVEATPACREI